MIGSLPQPRESVSFGAGFFLNTRGLFLPKPLFAGDAWMILAALAAGLAGAIGFRIWAQRRQAETGRQYPVGWTALALIVGLPALAWIALALAGANPIRFDVPEQSRFNLRGGMQLGPEFVALVLGLVDLHGRVHRRGGARRHRVGLARPDRGRLPLGLHPGQTLRLVVIPQAMRVIIPPLTNQYLNLTKNSSLAVAIGYPDLVQIFMGTVLNQTGQAIEIVAITMAVYLTISLVTSAVMNVYNRRMAIVER